VALHWASLVAALVCAVLRFRASTGTGRHRLLPNATSNVLYVGLWCPPAGVAVAVLPYRYHAARTVDAFATRLRDQVDLDALGAELLAAVDQTTQPTQGWLWPRPPAVPQPR